MASYIYVLLAGIFAQLGHAIYLLARGATGAQRLSNTRTSPVRNKEVLAFRSSRS
jgi:hypothetical protein